MDYKQKYLKYKSKYLQLKNLYKKGGVKSLQQTVIDKMFSSVFGMEGLIKKIKALIEQISTSGNTSINISYLIDVNNIIETKRLYFNNVEQIKFFNRHNFPLYKINFSYFNEVIEPNIIPDTVKIITFTNYNQEIGQNVLPRNLLVLNLGLDYNKKIGLNILPETLQELNLGNSYDIPLEENVLPINLQKLVFGKYSWNGGVPLAPGILPPNIKHLYFDGAYNYPIESGVIPNSVLDLRIYGKLKEKLIPHALPNSILYLWIGEYEFEFENHSLPNNLQRLYLNYYNKRIPPNTLPSHLVNIDFGQKFNNDGHEIEPNVFPNSVKQIVFGQNFKQLLTPENLPTHLESLYLTRIKYPYLDWLIHQNFLAEGVIKAI